MTGLMTMTSSAYIVDQLPPDMWGYAVDCIGCGGFPGGVKDFAMASCFDEEITTKLAGKKIDRLGVVAPMRQEEGTVELTLYLSYVLEGDAAVEVTFTTEGQDFIIPGSGDPLKYEIVELPEPIEIQAGVPFYVGLKTPYLDRNTYTLCHDNIPNPGKKSSMVYRGQGWENYSERSGTLSFFIGLDEMPENMVRVIGNELPADAMQGTPLTADITVFNIGGNAVDTANIHAVLGEQTTDMTASVDSQSVKSLIGGVPANEPIPVRQRGTITIDRMPVEVTGPINATFQIDKINGEANGWEQTMTKQMNIMPEGFGYTRNVVVEEATGTWCGWCIRGYVGMEYMAGKYTDGSYIGIATHQGDKMQATTYIPYLQTNTAGYPSAAVNRMEIVDPSKEVLEEVYHKYVTSPTYGKIDLTIDAVSDDFADVTSVSELALPGSYAVAYVVKENEVGPCEQNNYYSNTGADMGGFEDEPAKVELMFNDVARDIFDAFGINGSLPASIEVATPYTHSYEVSLKNVSDRENASIVAMIIDQASGRIVNAVEKSLGNSAVSDIEDTASTAVIASRGTITLAGEENGVVYDMRGRRIAAIAGNSSVAVAPGLYIVTVGARAHKVLVK